MANYTEIFVPGGFPEHTYNPRSDLGLEGRLAEVRSNLCKLAIVTGQTKSGKTVLVRRILPRESTVWIDGGSVGSESDLWSLIIEQLELAQTTAAQRVTETQAGISTKATGQLSLPLFGSAGTELQGNMHRKVGVVRSGTRTVSDRIAALTGLADKQRALVIDDFHYLPKDLQGAIVRALKGLIFDGVPVAIIAIPHRRYDAVKVEKEMTGRIWPIQIREWTQAELSFISQRGFKLLNCTLSGTLRDSVCEQSFGSPHLMQEFCRAICRRRKLDQIPETQTEIALSQEEMTQLFAEIAETIGRPIFERIAKGPRPRSDRLPRLLRNGQTVDIYRLIMHALAHLKPGLITLEYEDLRGAIKEIVADQAPQLHEVARVLKHMASIAATDASSTPVIDFEEGEKKLHITDPFFAFYLRWGKIDN